MSVTTVNLSASDVVYLCDATSAQEDITLPAATTRTVGVRYTYVKSDTSANAVVLTANGTEAIRNHLGTTYTLSLRGQAVTLMRYDSEHALADATDAGSIARHECMSVAHGVLGSIVGTSDAQELTNKTLTSGKMKTSLTDVAGNVLLKVPAIALTTPVNSLGILNSEAGNPPELYAQGTDTNIDVKLTPKGSGKLYEGTTAVALSGTQVIASTAAVTDPAAKACLDDIITALLASRVAQP